MSRTFRRINYEKEGRSKTDGSKISGKGYYTQSEFVEHNHPYLNKIMYFCTRDTATGRTYYDRVEIEGVKASVFVPTYLVWDEAKYYKDFYRIHGDNHQGAWTAKRWYSRYLNKKLRSQYKQYMHYCVKTGEEPRPEPRHKRTADYDYW